MPGDYRSRRLAAQRVPHPGGDPVLRRHLLPAGAPPRAAELAHGAGRRGRRVGEPARGDPRPERADGAGAERHHAARAVVRADPRRPLARATRCPARRLRPRERRLWTCAEVPAAFSARASAAPAASARCRSARSRRWPAAESTTRSGAASPATRSTPPGRCRTSRRCSTTTRSWSAPTCTAGRSRDASASDACAARRWTGPCARCRVPREASARRSTPTPRGSRASSTCGRSTSCTMRSASSLMSRSSISGPRRSSTSSSSRAADPSPSPSSFSRSGAACSRCARGECAPASMTSG